jgi:hypothetical protein
MKSFYPDHGKIEVLDLPGDVYEIDSSEDVDRQYREILLQLKKKLEQ